jgi:hypothetical protein
LKKYEILTDYINSIYYKALRKNNLIEKKIDKLEATNEILKFRNSIGRESQEDEIKRNLLMKFDEFIIKECFKYNFKIISNKNIETIYKETMKVLESENFKTSTMKLLQSKKDISDLFQSLKPFIFKEQLKVLKEFYKNDDSFEIWVNYKFQISNWLHIYANHDENLNKLTANHHENIFNWLSTLNQRKISKRMLISLVLLVFLSILIVSILVSADKNKI